MGQVDIIADSATLEGYFSTLSLPQHLPWVGSYPWQLLRFHRGEYLCQFGAPVPLLLLLLEGSVSISLTPGHGRTRLITLCQPGTLICGDVEVAQDGALATADLRAVEGEALCAGISISQHREALMQDLDFLRYAVRRLSQEMVKDSIYAANNLLFPLEDRMAGYILDTAGADGIFRANLTRTAELLGVSYRQLSRVLRSLSDQGRITRTRQGWQITDRPALERQSADILPLPLEQ